MNEQEKRDAILEYFLAPFPHRAVKTMIIGSIIALSGLITFLDTPSLLSAIVILVGALCFF